MGTLGGGGKRNGVCKPLLKPKQTGARGTGSWGTTCTGTLSGRLVNHASKASHSTETGKKCLSRKRGGRNGLGPAGCQSRTSYLSPGSDLRMFSCLSKER